MKLRNPMKRSLFEYPLFRNMFTVRETFFVDTDGLAPCRRNLLVANCLTGVISSLTAGIYFTGLMLAMGASEVYIGYVTAIISFCGFFQILSPLFLERIPRRKNLIMGGRALYHILNIGVIGVLPLLPIENSTKLALFIITLLILNISNALLAPGILTWHLQCLHNNQKRIGFFAICNMIGSVLNQVTVFLAGLFLDKFEADSIWLGNISPTLSAILILRCVAMALAVLECIFYMRIKEAPYAADSTQSRPVGLKLLLRPLKNKRFLQAISVPLIWGFSAAIVGQYFSIYLLEDVHMSYSMISLAGIISLPLQLIAAPIWTKALQRKPWYKAILIGQLINISAYILHPVVTADRAWFYFICVILSAVCSPGMSLAHTHLQYTYMPEENRTAYVSCNAVLTQLASFLGANVGVWFIQFSSDLKVNILGLSMGSKQLINLVTAALMTFVCIYAQVFVRKKLPE